MLSRVNQTTKVELLDNPKYYLTITALFRDESRFLKEWIEFYKLMGVEHFYLFNHLSKDNFSEVLAPYIQDNLVELRHLTYEPKNTREWYDLVQNPTYAQVASAIKDEVEWLMIVDTDEFLYPVQAYNITTVLRNYDEYASVSVNWRMFGTNNVQRIQDNELILEKLIKRDSNIDSTYVKTIVKPRYIDFSVGAFIDPHYPLLQSGHLQITENYNAIQGSVTLVPSYNILAINHYSHRDLDFFYDRKLARVHMLENTLTTQEKSTKINEFIQKDQRYSSVYDDSILRFAPALRAKMFPNEAKLSFAAEKILQLPHNQKISFLPNDLVFLSDNEENLTYSLANGYGYEPSLIKKIIAFTQPNQTYVEFGTGSGEFALQMSVKLGTGGKVYAFENNNKLFQFLTKNIMLNNIDNIKLHDLIPSNLDEYSKHIDIIRINLAGNECNILQIIQNATNVSNDLRLFVKWQSNDTACLSDLLAKGFILINLFKFHEECSLVYCQQDYIVSLNSLKYDDEILIIKEETFYKYQQISSNSIEGVPCVNEMFLTYRKSVPKYYKTIDGMKYILSQKSANLIDYLYKGGTALYWAVQDGELEEVEILLNAGANPDIKAINNETPLTMSVQNNDFNMTKLLIESGANIETPNGLGATPLYIAAYFGFDDVLKLLLDNDANKNVEVGGLDAFNRALKAQHSISAQILSGSTENFCHLILDTEHASNYLELCGAINE